MGFAFATGFHDVLGLLIGSVSSCYHDDARDPLHLNQFVNVDDAAFACPFPSALACVLFFHDASDPLHYLLKKKQKRNDHVYAFCVVLGLAPVTYREQIRYSVFEVNREYAQIPCGSRRRRWPDTKSTIDTLLSAAGEKKAMRVSDRRIHKANLPFKIVDPTVHPSVPSVHVFLLTPRGTILRWWVWPSRSVILRW